MIALPLPGELAFFQPISQNSGTPRCSYPWEVINTFWNANEKISNQYELLYEQSTMFRRELFVMSAIAECKRTKKRYRLLRTSSCTSLKHAQISISSMALSVLSPAFAKSMERSNSPTTPFFPDVMDTRDNVFDLNGYSLISEAMYLLNAAYLTLFERKDPDIQRYVDPSARWDTSVNQNKTLTEDFRILLEEKNRVAMDKEKQKFFWSLELIEDVDEMRENRSSIIFFDHAYSLYHIQKTELFFYGKSLYHGEPVTSLIYRVLLEAANHFQCGTMMKQLFREYSLSLIPPVKVGSHNYLKFYIESFFGVKLNRNGNETFSEPFVPNGRVSDSSYVLTIEINPKECAFYGMEDVVSLAEVQLSSKKKCFEVLSNYLLISTFSFALVEIGEYVKNLRHPLSPKQYSHLISLAECCSPTLLTERANTWTLNEENSRNAESIRRSIGLLRKCAFPDEEMPTPQTKNIPKSKISHVPSIALQLVALFFSGDYKVQSTCSCSATSTLTKSEQLFMCSISFIRHSISNHRAGPLDASQSSVKVFEFEGVGSSQDEAIQKALLKTLILLSSYIQMGLAHCDLDHIPKHMISFE